MDVLDRMGNPGHPEEDYLERYVMKTCTEQETDAIEEHLLICEDCRARLYGVEEWVSLMKTAIPLVPERRRVPRWRQTMELLFTRPMVLATGCVAFAAIVLTAPLLLRPGPPEEEWVTLAATRGTHTESAADSRHLLRLRVDTTGLVSPIEGQVVDATGELVMNVALTVASAEMKLDRQLKPGVYWVRINSGVGGKPTLREFRLPIK